MVRSKTLILKVDADNPDKDTIAYAAATIRNGGIVAFPTETVYGLAVNMLNLKAVGRLYGVKKRSRGKPSTIHVANLRDIKRIGCRITKRALDLMRRFWPGPLTIILRSMDGGTIGFRMPANNVALRLISASGVPVIAPSANISGKSPPTSAREVLKDLDGKIDLILDAGRTKIGVESTIVDISSEDPVVLREGAVSTKALSKVLRFK